jgi:vacuolar-type H+-ATPase subunit C/Vma6
MTRSFCDNVTYLAAKLHARRSRLLEGERLETLCRIGTLPEFGRAIGLGANDGTIAEMQRELVANLVHELAGYLKHLDEAGSDLLFWMLFRFQIENVKVLLRGFINKIPKDELRSLLHSLPGGLALDFERLIASSSLDDLAAQLPWEKPYERLRVTIATERENSKPFIFEMALDSGYFAELLARARRLSEDDFAVVRPLLMQEANQFQFMGVIRGKFLYKLPLESLALLRLEGVSDDWLPELWDAPDIMTAARLSPGIVLDELPAEGNSRANAFDPLVLEGLAWNRYQRLANHAFRRGHVGLGSVIGYAALRRLEVANLIMLSEGIPMRLKDAELSERLIPRKNLEAAYV